MKVALVHDPLYKLGGAERILQAIHELYPAAPLYTPIYDPSTMAEAFKGWEISTSFLQKWPGRLRLLNFYRAFMPLAVEQWDLSDYDLVISSSTSVAKGVITRQDAIHLCYLHNATRFAWYDLEEHLSGAGFSLTAWPARLALSYFRAWDFLAADRPDYFIANSQNTAAKARKYYRREVDTVIYPFVELQRFRANAKVGDYFLIVSRLEPHKRVDLAIAAFNELRFPLKVVGTGPQMARLRAMARKNIEFLGRLSDSEVGELLPGCRAFLYPQEEDFGISALEAMACGRPVIAYGKGGARETIRPGVTGEFFAEQTADSLKSAVARFDPKRYTASRIREHAATFSRDRFKREFRQFVGETITRHGT